METRIAKVILDAEMRTKGLEKSTKNLNNFKTKIKKFQRDIQTAQLKNLKKGGKADIANKKKILGMRRKVLGLQKRLDPMVQDHKVMKNQAAQASKAASIHKKEADTKDKKVNKTWDEAKSINDLTNKYNSFWKVMRMGVEDWKKVNKGQGVFSNKNAKLANTIRKTTHGMRGFRMEMLGIMFFGQGLSRFFKGLLLPALELAGVMEVLRLVLGILFLPVALDLLDALVDIGSWFMGLPEWAKKAIGWFVVLSAVFWGLVSAVGMFTLGIGSMILAFAPVATMGEAFTLLGAGIAAAAPVIGIALAAILVLIAGFLHAWETDFLGIKGLVENVKEGFVTTWEGIKDFFEGNIIDGLIKIFKGFPKAILNAWGVIGISLLAYQKMVIGTAFQFGKDLVDEIADGIRSMPTALQSAFTAIMPFGLGQLLGGLNQMGALDNVGTGKLGEPGQPMSLELPEEFITQYGQFIDGFEQPMMSVASSMDKLSSSIENMEKITAPSTPVNDTLPALPTIPKTAADWTSYIDKAIVELNITAPREYNITKRIIGD